MRSQKRQLNRPFMASQKPQRGSGAPVGFINPMSPMDPFLYKTRPSRRCSDSTRLGRPRYTMTGQDHDPVLDRHLRPGDPIGGATGRPGRGGTAVRLRPTFSDREYARTSARYSFPTDTVGADWERPTRDARSVWARGAGGADKVRRSSQPQFRGPYPAMPCAPAGRCRRGMSGEYGRTCQTRQSINSIVGAVVCRTRRTR